MIRKSGNRFSEKIMLQTKDSVLMPSASRIVQLSPLSARSIAACEPAVWRPIVAETGCRGIGAIHSFHVQFRPDSFMPRTISARLGNVCRSYGLDCVPCMEPTMISLKALSTAAAMALVLPVVAPSASFAQMPNGGKPGVAGAGVRAGGGAASHIVGGGGDAQHISGGGFRQGAGGGVNIGGGAPGPRFSAGGGGGPSAQMGGGGYRGGYGGGHHHGGGGFIPGAVAGAVIGGAIASQGYYGDQGYYGGPGYYYGDAPAPAYYDNQYYDDSATVAAAPEGGDDVAYCIQRYRSYDPQSGTYLGNDGYRHPCP